VTLKFKVFITCKRTKFKYLFCSCR